MLQILVVTRIPFWGLGAGDRMRLLALMWVLGSRFDVTVLYLGPMDERDVQTIKQLKVRCSIQALPSAMDDAGEQLALKSFCTSHRFDVCILQQSRLHHLLEVLPAKLRTVMDTHDLESDRAGSQRSQGLAVDKAISFEHELALLSRYDLVLLIQPEDHARVAVHMGSQALLVPHAVQFSQQPVRTDGHRLGLVASRWRANRDGLDWFVGHVWPGLVGTRADMHLYGSICNWQSEASPDFHRHGFVSDFSQVWGQIDIAVNPVLWGSGLKIKCVEALGHGLPLVTTVEGARGLMDGAGEVFELAHNAEEFAAACRRLLTDEARRRQLGSAAYAYALKHFSPGVCFGPLVRWLQG